MIIGSYMVLCNEEEFCAYSLASIHKLVDFIVIVDNGGQDRSEELYTRFPKVKKIIKMPGGYGKVNEKDLRNAGIDACRKLGANFILKWDADEVLYEKQEQVIREAIKEIGYGAWFFSCHRFTGNMDYVQDLRLGDERVGDDPNYLIDIKDWGKQVRHGKIVLFRVHPRLQYVEHPDYIGLHSSEYETALPREYKIMEVWYSHYEWVKSNKELYDRAMLYYSLVRDPNDFCHTKEFQDSIDPELTLKEQRLRPHLGNHPMVMELFQPKFKVSLILNYDERHRLLIKKRICRKNEDWQLPDIQKLLEFIGRDK